MKKLIAVILAACALFCLFLLPAGAQTEKTEISLRLNSHIAGCTRADADQLIEILSGPVKYCYDEKGYSIFIANCVGGMEGAHMDAGRTYVITYTLEASDGYVLPETLSDGDVLLDCAKGVSVISCGVVEQKHTDPDPASGEATTARVLRITAKVVVDGTSIQKVIGWLRDLLLKIRSWSLF